MKQSKKIGGFSLVELLVTVSILATISIVAYVSYNSHLRTSYNATRIETIDSLYLSLSDYSQLKKTLPEANSNYISYDEQGTYMHSLSGAYGVSGYVSNNFLPAGYVNFAATDPENKQYYGYGKLTDNSSFDLAAALYDDLTGGYKTYLRGTYPKDRLTSLVRSYSSSNFVSQDSTENLPYNPYERKVSAFVSSYSGVVAVANSAGNTLSLTGELNSGDSITVATGATALLHISDGSELSLGSTTTQTQLALSTLVYNDDNNLASKVSLLLSLGEVWVEAPHLRTETDSASDFSIQTDSALAAVRGTVFGVTKNPLGITKLSLAAGKLEVSKLNAGGISTKFSTVNGFSVNSLTGFVLEGIGTSEKSYMVVGEGETAIALDGITNGVNISTSTSALTPTEIKTKIHHPSFSEGYRPKTDKISFGTGVDAGTGILSVTFKNPGATSYYLSFGTGIIDSDKDFFAGDPNPSLTGALSSTGGIVTLTGAFVYSSSIEKRTYVLRICMDKKCSAPDIKVLVGDLFAIDHFGEWGKHQTDCPANPAKARFWTKDCLTGENENLVAYAPYDTKGDLNMYVGEKDKKRKPLASSGILNNGDNISLSFATGVVNYITGSSFVEMQDGTKGIFINAGTSDYLKYNTALLHLTGSFSIEMRVREAALQRSTTNYALFSFSGASLMNEWTFNNILKIGTGTLGTSYFLSTSSISSPSSNTFYTVRTIIDSSNITLQISDDRGINLYSPSSEPLSSFPLSFDTLYVGSSSDSSHQWNDIIDSVKIYKN